MTERQKLGARSRYLRSKMRQIGPMITGSVTLRHKKCGKSNCRCRRRYPHFTCEVAYKEKGKTKTVYVDKKRQGEALLWSRNYKLFKKLLKEHTEINLALLKSDRKRKEREREREMKETHEEELTELKQILKRKFPSLRKTADRNLTFLIFAFVLLLRTYRGWYGRLTLSGIARCLSSKGTGKSRYKRLTSFLDNKNFQMINLTEDLTRLICPEEDLLPVMIDQTAIGDVQVISANVPTQGRSIPLATSTFEYGKIETSQNLLEEEFLTSVTSQLPKGIKVVQVADRGYGKSILLKNRLERKELFIIRGKRDVVVHYEENGKTCRRSLGRLKYSLGKPYRYRNCLTKEERK